MAKKKTKKKSTDVGKIALFAILLFTVVAIVMAFLANVKYPALIGEDTLISGFDVMFGWKAEMGKLTVELSSFSFLALLAYLLPIIGLVLAFVFNKSKLLSVVPLVCFIAAAVLMFLMPDLVVFGSEYANKYSGGELAFGAIIAGVVNILSAIAVVAKILLS